MRVCACVCVCCVCVCVHVRVQSNPIQLALFRSVVRMFPFPGSEPSSHSIRNGVVCREANTLLLAEAYRYVLNSSHYTFILRSVPLLAFPPPLHPYMNLTSTVVVVVVVCARPWFSSIFLLAPPCTCNRRSRTCSPVARCCLKCLKCCRCRCRCFVSD